MKINRRSIAAGLTVGVLAGGAGGAIAATTSASRTANASSTTTSSATGGWARDEYRWGGAGWGGPQQTGVRWDGSGSGDTNIGGMGWLSLVRSGRRAAQTYLGLSGSQLRSRLKSGKTLAQIAAGQGKSAAGLESAIESAVTDDINAESTLTASEKSSIVANLTGLVESVVTRTWDASGGPWHDGPAGPMTSGGW